MESVDRLVRIMARLRDPETGCPWDAKQRFETIAPYTIEEAYEVDDAIRRRDLEALRDELGDLLLQVVYHARMAEEEGRFALADVAESICEKLVRRHPHVFADGDAKTAEAVRSSWEALKEAERGPHASAVDDVPLAMPALLRVQKLQRRASRIGFDEVAAASEPLDAERVGEALFAWVDRARRQGIDAEQALRDYAARFEQRVRDFESTGRGRSS